MSKLNSVVKHIDRNSLYFGLLTWLMLFGYQLVFYSYYRYTESPLLSGQRNVFSYYSGILGDGLILPILNILVFVLLRSLGVRLQVVKLVFFLALGLGATVTFHFLQASLSLTNWSMPEPFNWSGLGKFHFFSMWGEFSFLFLALFEVSARWRSFLTYSWQTWALGLIWLSLWAFLLTFIIDYYELVSF